MPPKNLEPRDSSSRDILYVQINNTAFVTNQEKITCDVTFDSLMK